jgi:prophage maintenance system killer protein
LAEYSLRSRDETLAWWRDHVESGRLVLPRREQPQGPGRRLLLRGGYVLEVAGGQAWILKTPQREADRDLCLRNYWRIVEAILANYEPAVLERESAVQLYLEDPTPPKRLRIRQASSRSNYTFRLCDDLEVQVMPGELALDQARRVAIDGATILVDRPERTLLALPLTTLRDHLEKVAVWLRSLVVSRPALEADWARMPRPLVLRRLAELARDGGNSRLADQLDELLAVEHGEHISRARTGVGSEIVVPPVVSQVEAVSPWLARHEVVLRRFFDQMVEAIDAEADDFARFDRAELTRQARAAKSYDAYHSTTIEGYRITPEEVSAVIGGREVGGHDPEDVKARMAVKGYSIAFDRCLAVVNDSTAPSEITESLIQQLYFDLFSPSVEAGIVDADTLRGWRSSPAYLRGTRYVPPSPEKVPQLMQQHVRLVNEKREPPVPRAALAHLDFAAVHPFPDGNGRIARFLMNLCLVTAGLPWVTIRTDDRLRYFQALEAATVGDDGRPFARFILDYVQRAVDSA